MRMCDVQCLFEIVFENLFEIAVRITHSKVFVFEHMFEIHFEQGFEHVLECSVDAAFPSRLDGGLPRRTRC